MNRIPFFLSWLLLLMLVIQGCKDNPTSVGLGLLRSGDLPRIEVDTLYASAYSTVPSTVNTFGSDRLLVGNNAGYNAVTLLRFTGLPAGIFDTASITDARIQLHAIYHFGDAAAAISFQGYRLIASSDSATYDSLTNTPSIFYSSSPVLSFLSATLDDTTTINCPVDTGVVHSWFTTDSSAYNYGVVLIPTNTGVIKGFASFYNATSSYRPTLVIDYVSNGVPGSVTYTTGVARFLANIDQTTLVAQDPQSMFVQAGVAYRGQLEFNLRALPKAGLILKAALNLTANPAPYPSAFSPFLADTLYSYFVNPDSTVASLPVQGSTLTGGVNKVYDFEIGNYVRSWANGDTVQKLQFGALRESSSLDAFAIYGPFSTNAEFRPKLIITKIAQ